MVLLNILPTTPFLMFISLQEANKPPDSWFELKVNTHVYVTGLPEDVTVDEVSPCHFVSPFSFSCVNKLIWNASQMVEVFSKCGIIKEVRFQSYII